jgi:hypothetical protein
MKSPSVGWAVLLVVWACELTIDGAAGADGAAGFGCSASRRNLSRTTTASERVAFVINRLRLILLPVLGSRGCTLAIHVVRFNCQRPGRTHRPCFSSFLMPSCLRAETRRMSTRPHHSIEFRSDEQERSTPPTRRRDLAALDRLEQSAPRRVTQIRRSLGGGQIGRNRPYRQSRRPFRTHLAACNVGRRQKLAHLGAPYFRIDGTRSGHLRSTMSHDLGAERA